MRTTISFGRMQTSELLRLAKKKTSWDEMVVITGEIKPAAKPLSSYICLKASVSKSAENFVE